MEYRLTPKSKGNKKKVVLPLVVLAVLVIGAYLFRSPLTSIVLRAGEPIWQTKAESAGQASVATGFLSSKQDLLDELERLRQAQTETEGLRSYNNLLARENAELRRDRELFGDRAVSAGILVRPPQSAHGTLVIDAGKREGVGVGDIILAYPGVALGRIEEAHVRQSKVQLFSSDGRETEVLVGTERESLTALGRGSGNFVIEAPQDLEFDIGQSIILPNDETMLLGEIASINKVPSDPTQRIYFRYPLNINSLRRVWVVEGR